MNALFDLLPSLYALSDVDGELERFLDACQDLVDAYNEAIRDLPDLMDPDRCPEEFLDDLLLNVANPFQTDALTAAQKRGLCRQLFQIYRWKGTKRGIVLALRAVLGLQAMVVSWWGDSTGRLSEETSSAWILGQTAWGTLPADDLADTLSRDMWPVRTETPSPFFPYQRVAHSSLAPQALTASFDVIWDPAVVYSAEFPVTLRVAQDQLSSFDVFLEYSLDGGFTWIPVSGTWAEITTEPSTITEISPGWLEVVVDEPSSSPATWAFSFRWDISALDPHPGVILRASVREHLSGVVLTANGDQLLWIRVNNSQGAEDEPDLFLRETYPPIACETVEQTWQLPGRMGRLSDTHWKDDPARFGFYHFEVVPMSQTALSEDTKARLGRVVDFMKPAHTHWALTELSVLDGTVEDVWILGRSRLGTGTRLPEGNPLVFEAPEPYVPELNLLYWILGTSALGDDTRLFQD